LPTNTANSLSFFILNDLGRSMDFFQIYTVGDGNQR